MILFSRSSLVVFGWSLQHHKRRYLVPHIGHQYLSYNWIFQPIFLLCTTIFLDGAQQCRVSEMYWIFVGFFLFLAKNFLCPLLILSSVRVDIRHVKFRFSECDCCRREPLRARRIARCTGATPLAWRRDARRARAGDSNVYSATIKTPCFRSRACHSHP